MHLESISSPITQARDIGSTTGACGLLCVMHFTRGVFVCVCFFFFCGHTRLQRDTDRNTGVCGYCAYCTSQVFIFFF